MPLKRVDPFVVRVDNATGIVDVVPVYDGRATPQEAVTRYFLTHYLTVCERFNFATAESDYEECGAFHSPQRNQVWYAQWTATNPASPLNVHKDGSTVSVQVKSVSFFTRASGLADLAQVRYLKALRARGRRPKKPSVTGSRPSNTPMRNPRRIRRRGAGIRWDSRSWNSSPSRRCRRWATRARIIVMILSRVRDVSNAARAWSGPRGRLRCRARSSRPRCRPRRCRPGARSTVASATAPYDSDQVYRVRGFVGYQIDFEFEPGKPSSVSAREIIEGLSYFGAGQSPVPEAEGCQGRHQPHRAHQPTALSDRLHGRCRSGRARTIRTSCSRCGSSIRRVASQSAAEQAAKRIDAALERRVRQAAAKYRLLVLRQPDAEAHRRVGRRHAYATEIRGERRSAGDLRAQ